MPENTFLVETGLKADERCAAGCRTVPMVAIGEHDRMITEQHAGLAIRLSGKLGQFSSTTT